MPKRRGRKRKTMIARQPNGQPYRPADRGTDELQRERAWYGGDGDKALTGYPLGVLLANEAISEEQHRAGCRYAWLHHVVFGRPSVAATKYIPEPAGKAPDDSPGQEKWLASQEHKLSEIIETLKTLTARHKMTLDSIAVYERTPNFMRPVLPRLSDVREAEALFVSLEILVNRCAKALSEAA